MKLKIVFILLLCQQFIIAQLTDDFSDNDFSNNPTWSGDVEKFDVLDEQLHLNDTTNNSPAILFTAASTQGLATWEFSILLDFNPSSSNYAKVYLNASSSDLDADLNGYYVRVGGESGDVDDFSLYKQTGSASTKIIDGIDGLAAGDSVLAKVRVTRDDLGNWELFVDKDLAGDFQSQGTVLDDEFLDGAFLGVWCKYTSTRSDKFYFDDFLVDPIFEDTDPPELISIVVLGPNELELNFSEELDLNTAQNNANYNVEGFGNPELAILNQENPSQVLLTFENSFQLNVEQTMTVANLQDLAGNILQNASGTFTYEMADYRSVVINEIMADATPVVGLPESEFVELYNRTSGNLDLSGWAFSDLGDIVAIPEGTIIEANSYLILCPSSEIDLWIDYPNKVGISLPNLNNGGDDLSLFDDLGNLIDNVNYSNSWYGDDNKDGGGYTLELLDADYPCQGAFSWAASVAPEGGTPGEKNSQEGVPFDDVGPSLISAYVVDGNSLVLTFSESLDAESVMNDGTLSIEPNLNIGGTIYNQEVLTIVLEEALQEGIVYTITVEGVSDCSGNVIGMFNQGRFLLGALAFEGDVAINEIMADATPVVGLPESEFVELYNRTNKNFDLSGWSFSDSGDPVSIPKGAILEANSYLILCPSSKIDLWADYPNKVGISLPNLNNDGDDLSLFDDLGNLIGNVNYSDSWYGDDDKDDGGYTLELLDADYPCQGASSWAASVAPKGGTPGEKNSQDGVPFDDVGPSLISVYLVDGNSLVLTFSESLDEESVTNDGTLSIEPNLNIGATIYNQEVLRVLLEEPLEEGTVYTITVEGVSDCVGNVIGMFNQGKFLLGSLAFEGDVVINEIMANEKPSVGLPESEFVELYNRSNKNFDLSGWSFSDSGDPVSIPKGAILEANSYLILCPSSKTDLWADYPNKVGISMPNLNNDGDDLSLFDNLGNLIDNVNYSDSWYGDDNKDDGGYTLELLDADYPCQGASSWAASVAPKGGTPGEKNSQDEVPFDDVGPSLISAYVVDGNSLVLTFSESLDEESVTNEGTLSIEPNLSIGATIYNQEVLRVLLEEPLEEGRIYTITVEGVSDCVGNVIGMFNQGRFLLGSLAFKGDVVINEIMADANPSVGLPESEFIELYNRTDKNFDLSDWAFDNKIPKGAILEANSYLILCSDKSLWTDYENVLEIDMPTLNNTSDDLSLFDGLGNLIDNVNYSNSWYGDDNKDDGGYTLELLDADYPCQGISSWAASIDPKGGTPGEKNSQEGVPFDDVRPDLIAAHVVDGDSLVLTFSEALDEESVMNIGYLNIEPNLNTAGITIYEQEVLIIPLQDTMQDGVVYTVTVEGVADCRDNNVIGMFNQASFGIGYLAAEGDIIINEILADPISGGADYVELYNMSDKPIDLSNYSIAHVSSSVPDELEDITEITPNGYLFLPDSYVVLSKNVEWVRTYYGGCANLAPTNFISVSSFPDLRQDDDIVILFETGNQEKVLDQVKYFNAWHNQLLDATKSISLERIDPDGPSNDGNNWSSASINNCGGTPSNGNSQFYQGMSLGEDEIQIDPKIFNPDIGGNANFTQINYQFDKSDNVMSVTIYDDNGRLIRRIAESEVVGSSGSYKWDGADDAGEKALMGIYIVFIEVFDLDGNAKTLKETLVVAGNLD